MSVRKFNIQKKGQKTDLGVMSTWVIVKLRVLLKLAWPKTK